MTDSLSQLAQQFVTGEWLFDAQQKTLKKSFSSDEKLLKLNLIDAEGYLSLELKSAITQALGKAITEHAVGPFGDEDIFSGDVVDDITYYNIEIHQVTESILAALKRMEGVTIKVVDAHC